MTYLFTCTRWSLASFKAKLVLYRMNIKKHRFKQLSGLPSLGILSQNDPPFMYKIYLVINYVYLKKEKKERA